MIRRVQPQPPPLAGSKRSWSGEICSGNTALGAPQTSCASRYTDTDCMDCIDPRMVCTTSHCPDFHSEPLSPRTILDERECQILLDPFYCPFGNTDCHFDPNCTLPRSDECAECKDCPEDVCGSPECIEPAAYWNRECVVPECRQPCFDDDCEDSPKLLCRPSIQQRRFEHRPGVPATYLDLSGSVGFTRAAHSAGTYGLGGSFDATGASGFDIGNYSNSTFANLEQQSYDILRALQTPGGSTAISATPSSGSESRDQSQTPSTSSSDLGTVQRDTKTKRTQNSATKLPPRPADLEPVTLKCQWHISGGSDTENLVLCGYVTQSGQAMCNHIDEVHITAIKSTSKNWVCGWYGCDRQNTEGFGNKAKLRRHCEIHCLYNGFQCPECLALCRTQQCLDNHMRTHTGECPFKCPYEANGPRLYAESSPDATIKPAPKCSGAFGTKTGLDTHIRAIHTREKKFVCDFDGCDFACADSSNLSKHRRKHLGGNPKVFRCLHPGCGHAPKGSWDEIRRHFVAKGHCPELLDDQGDAQAEYKRKAREAKKMAPETRAREAKMRQVKMLKRGKAAAANSGTGHLGSTHPAPTAPDMMMMETTTAATTTYDYALPSAETGPLDMMMF